MTFFLIYDYLWIILLPMIETVRGVFRGIFMTPEQTSLQKDIKQLSQLHHQIQTNEFKHYKLTTIQNLIQPIISNSTGYFKEFFLTKYVAFPMLVSIVFDYQDNSLITNFEKNFWIEFLDILGYRAKTDLSDEKFIHQMIHFAEIKKSSGEDLINKYPELNDVLNPNIQYLYEKTNLEHYTQDGCSFLCCYENNIPIVILAFYNSNVIYEFTPMKNWEIGKYLHHVNRRIFQSLKYHQVLLGFVNFGVYGIMKNSFHYTHPISKLFDIFFEGQYLNNAQFESNLDIGLGNRGLLEHYFVTSRNDNELFNFHAEGIKSFVSNLIETKEPILSFYRYIDRIQDSELNNLQIDILKDTYDMIFKFVDKTVRYYFDETSVFEDFQVDKFIKLLQLHFPNDEPINSLESMINLLTNIFHLSSVVHSIDHVDTFFKNEIGLVDMRRDYAKFVINQLKTSQGNITLEDIKLQPSCKLFYNRIASFLGPIIPLNSIEYGLENRFQDKNINMYLEEFKQTTKSLKKKYKRTKESEFLFRCMRSNVL